MSDQLSFKAACEALGISEAELERLVANGEIASVKDGDTMYFTRDVIDRYRSSRTDEATILLADDEINLLDDDGLEEIDLGTPAETTSVVGGDTVEDLVLDTDDSETADLTGGSGDETILNLDGILEEEAEGTTPIPGGDLSDDTLLDTELLDLSEDGDTFDVDTAEDLTVDDLTEQGTLLRGGGARVMQMKRKKSHAAWTACLVAAALILIIPLGVTLQTFYANSGMKPDAVPDQEDYKWIHSLNVGQVVIEGTADGIISMTE